MAQQALFAYITKDYSKAENLYNQYLTQNPNDYQILVARSALYYTLGKFEDAIKDSDKAIVKDRSRYEAYF